MRFKNYSRLFWCFLLLCGAAQAQSTAAPALTECLDVKVATTSKTPLDLWRSIPTCAKEDKHEQAIFMFGLAGALGVFDSMRVKDVSARQAAKVLPMGGISAMGQEKSQQFQKQIQERFGEPAKRLDLCKTYKSMPPPTYFPDYMINHGLVNLSGKPADAFVAGFNAAETWPQAIDIYMQCPKG
jgi:hypothetical protein